MRPKKFTQKSPAKTYAYRRALGHSSGCFDQVSTFANAFVRAFLEQFGCVYSRVDAGEVP
jgi:hypothetical protein